MVMKRNELIWCQANMIFKLFLFSFLLQHSLGFNIADDDKRTLPLSLTGRDRLLAALEDKSLTGGLIAYPRLGRHIWEIERALSAHPGASSLLAEPSSLDYDIFLNADASNSDLEDSISDVILRDGPTVQKRRNVKLIPRIGRKKRSLPDGGEKKDAETEENGREAKESDLSGIHWNDLDRLGNDYYFRQEDQTYKQKKNYLPTLGEKNYEFLNMLEGKRAVAFTPRIGRASLIPRIGRNDPRFRLKSRTAFVPRIGRRAALIPRIGRSEHQRSIEDGAD